MEKQRVSEGTERVRALVGREREQTALTDLLATLRSGRSQALVVVGEPGIGKTALLDLLAERATDCRVVRMSGVEAEMELPFAAMHQLCAPFLDRRDVLPSPQRRALEVTFGLDAGPAPDRMLLGLAVLSLLSEVAADRPVVCVIDDAQWLDRESAEVISFVARRLGAESLGIVIATRELGSGLSGLPSLTLGGLHDEDARALLTSVLTMPVDQRVLDQFVTETHGNPLALLELPRGLNAADLAGGFALPQPGEVAGSIQERFRQRVERLPEATQRILLLGAADPTGDPLLLWRAAELLGIDAAAARPAIDDDLISFGARVRFRHPLVRSAIYRSSSDEARRAAHAALANAIESPVDAERRAWHRAKAVAQPDEEIAAELESYADRAQARGGLAAAAAFLERATELSESSATRARRALAAGEAKIYAGAFTSAINLLALAEAGHLDERDRAKLDRVRAQLAFATSRGGDAPSLLLQAAKRLESVDVDLARATYLDAMMAAHLAVSLAGPSADVSAAARAAASAPRPSGAPTPADLLLDGLAATYTQSYGAGLPLVREAVAADTTGFSAHQELRWLSVASRAAMHIWDDARALAHSTTFIDHAREAGALTELVFAVNDHSILATVCGQPTRANSAVEEAYAIAEAYGSSMVPWGPMGVAAWRGQQAEAIGLIKRCKDSALQRGEGGAVAGAEWAEALLCNGYGRYPEALSAARRAIEWTSQGVFGLDCWLLPELIEASSRTGIGGLTDRDFRLVEELTMASRTDWSLAVWSRAQALASPDDSAEEFYRESIERYSATTLVAEVARAHLLLGEWLRRERRRIDARSELNVALEMFEEMGMESFAERTRRELRATGQTARKRHVENRGALTAQESQVAQLAREGLSNPEIAARLFISSRTVQYHLSKVFAKLGVTSRKQLDHVLS